MPETSDGQYYVFLFSGIKEYNYTMKGINIPWKGIIIPGLGIMSIVSRRS